MRGRLVALAFSVLACGTVLADAPLPPPALVTAWSPSRHLCLVSDPRVGTRAFHMNPDGSRSAPLWSIPGWHRVLFIANDGHHAVTGYDAVLLPLDGSPRDVLLTFWRDGVKVRDVPLSELVTDMGKLQRTTSHLRWGRYVGFDEAGTFVVETVERPVVRFDPATGKIVRP